MSNSVEVRDALRREKYKCQPTKVRQTPRAGQVFVLRISGRRPAPMRLLFLLVLAALVPLTPVRPAAGQGLAAAYAPADATADLGFRFVRIRYRTNGYSRAATWAYDYPTAEQNLYVALERTTKLYLEGAPLVLTLHDERIFDYPVLYLCEPGFWQTDDEEVANLK